MSKLFDDFLRPFSPAQIASMLTMAMEMETYGLTAADVAQACREYMTNLQKEMEARQPLPDIQRSMTTKKLTKRQHEPLLRCPIPGCGSPVDISPVNVSKCTQVGGEWHSSLMCRNPRCRFTELSTKTIEQWGTENGHNES